MDVLHLWRPQNIFVAIHFQNTPMALWLLFLALFVVFVMYKLRSGYGFQPSKEMDDYFKTLVRNETKLILAEENPMSIIVGIPTRSKYMEDQTHYLFF